VSFIFIGLGHVFTSFFVISGIVMNAPSTRRHLVTALSFTFASFFTTFSYGQTQSWTPPTAEKRCPSKWGASDQRGAANLMTDKTVFDAARLIQKGEIFELGKVLDNNIPKFGARVWALNPLRTVGPNGTNQQIGNEEIVTTELGALAHMGIGEHLYNCTNNADVAKRDGFHKLGVENIGTLMSRGVLLDIAALKGVDILAPNYEITVEDLKAAITKQNTPVGKADIVLIRTGWGQHYGTDNATFKATEPGLGIAAAEWLAAKDIMLVGSDNWGIEVFPNPDKTLRFPVHQIMLTVHGIYQIENLNLEELSKANAYEFAFAVQPLKIKGGTGSSVAPIAIR
jgi:kynurenine formamidase